MDPDAWAAALADQTRRGLRAEQPWIPPLWFYDDEGSALFDAITGLDAYYPTRAERAILAAHANDIARRTRATTLVELGSGTSEKTRLLLDAMTAIGDLELIVLLDGSAATVESAAAEVAREFPRSAVHAVVGDFHRHLADLPSKGVRLMCFLGSTIGNLDPDERGAFLDGVSEGLDPGEWFLLGTDLIKDPDRLRAAYDDEQGLTAAFDLNALVVMNRVLGTDFNPAAYRHEAFWDEGGARIEMRLVALTDQLVDPGHLGGPPLRLAAGEWIRTEISSKFTAEQVRDELVPAGLIPEEQWTDDAGDFLLTLARRAA